MARAKHGKLALVTGGSRGIGLAIVEALLTDGWRVAFCSRTAERVEAALGRLRNAHGEAVAGHAVDVREQEQVDAWVEGAAEAAGRLDCLVNNAGIGAFGRIDEMSGDEWREVLRTNLDGAFYAIRAAAPRIVASGGGWIFNIGSLAGKNPFAGGAAYNASKFGLLGMSEAAMLDLRHDGVRIACIMPGSVDTEFGSGRPGRKSGWALTAEDVARIVMDCLRFPERALPSRIEIRPSQPPRK